MKHEWPHVVATSITAVLTAFLNPTKSKWAVPPWMMPAWRMGPAAHRPKTSRSVAATMAA